MPVKQHVGREELGSGFCHLQCHSGQSPALVPESGRSRDLLSLSLVPYPTKKNLSI